MPGVDVMSFGNMFFPLSNNCFDFGSTFCYMPSPFLTQTKGISLNLSAVDVNKIILESVTSNFLQLYCPFGKVPLQLD